MSGARIHLCGRLAVEWEGEALEDRLPGRQGRLLFAYLVLHRERPVRRDELAGALWADGGSDALLAPPLSRLRRALGEGRLEGRSDLRLALPDDAWVDWEAAHDGVARARTTLAAGAPADAWGPASAARAIADRGLLPGLEAPWIDALRTELLDLRVEALELLARAGVQLGGEELAPAERAARAAVEAAPFRESAHAALIDALIAQGNPAEALRVYEEIRVRLREELGTTPGPDLASRHERLLRTGEGTVPSPVLGSRRKSGEGSDPSPEVGMRGREDPALVEREQEVSALAALLDGAANGVGGVALLEGPAGVGKTRLLSEARRLATGRGMLTLAGRGGELERDFPFGVVRQLFEAEVRGRELTGAAAPAGVVFGGAAGEDAGSFAVLHGLFWLTLDLAAERPILLAVDDLQWCDLASLRFLAYLVRRLEGVPALVAATLRTGEPPTDVALLDEIVGDPATTPIRPAPLTEDAVSRVAADRLGAEPDATFTHACSRATGGNPLLLRQLLSALSADGVRPDARGAEIVSTTGARAVGRTVITRLNRLAPETAEVARAVAILGEAAALPAVAALAGVDQDRAAAAVAALARAEILSPEPPAGFVHPLVRDAVYHDMAAVERQRAHATAARVLHEAGAGADEVGLQLLQVPPGGDAWVAARLTDAGHAAAHQGAAEAAVRYLRRALDEPPPPDTRPRRLLELGQIETHTDVNGAAAHLREAYDTLADPAERGEAAHALVRTLFFVGDPPTTVALARRLQAELPPEHDDLRMAIESVELHVAFLMGVGDPLDRLEQYVETPPEGDGFGPKALLAQTAWRWAATGGPADRCSEMALHAMRDRTLMTLDPGLISSAVMVVLTMADREEAMDLWEHMRREAHRTGSLFITLTIDLWRGWTLLHRGELEEAETSLTASVEETRRWGSEAAISAYSWSTFARMLVERGRLDEARRALERATPPPPGSESANWLHAAWAELAMADGDPARAVAATDLIETSTAPMTNPSWLPWRAVRAEALAALGRTEEAVAAADEDLAYARRWGAPATVGRALRTRGVVTGDTGLLAESIATLEGVSATVELTRSLGAHGAALVAAGEADAGTRQLTRALALAERAGAVLRAGRLRDLLRDAGVEPPRDRPAALTEIERRAIELADGGADPRTVAQALFLTPHEAEEHLERARRKLAAA